ncbi:unnamed protein product, partial [Heterotrigona itama]
SKQQVCTSDIFFEKDGRQEVNVFCILLLLSISEVKHYSTEF